MAKLDFKKRVLFIGVPDMAYVGLNALCYAGVNIVGVLGPEKTHNTYFNFKRFVESRELNFIEYDSLESEDFLKSIEDLNIDIAVVCSYNKKIPNVFIDKIKDGIINSHPSLLPSYRGGNPYSKVIENGEEKTGVTLHYMSEAFDSGDIILQEELELMPYETMGTLFNKTNTMICNMLLKVLFYYEKNGNLPSKPQEEGEFPVANNYKNNELFLDYNKTSTELERFVRALNPFLTPMTIFRNQFVKIFKISIADCPEAENYENGQICKIENDKVYIKTNNGCIVPDIMQFGSLFIGDCTDFIKIVKPKLGEKFTNGYS